MARPARTRRAAVPANAPTQAPYAISTPVILAALTLLNLLVYLQVLTHDFVHLDDGQFVLENQWVRQGLTGATVRWALTSFSLGYYPLTWLSHALDVQVWGLNAGAHLATSLLLHIISTALLYVALARLTCRVWPSAVVAALFAVHPMHVESVAWVSERKDTLSTVFVMLALYLYSSREGWRRIGATALALTASLLSKQMYVTFPFLLMLLDFWPLRRLNWRAVVEKVPLILLSFTASAIAIVGQKQLNAVQSTDALPMSERIANALLAYVTYIGKLFWPQGMAPMYPLTTVPVGTAMGALALLAGITIAAWLWRVRAPWLMVGWCWFLGTLVPVIGIVQIGPQALADRYTYFSYIGLFIAIVWSVDEVARLAQVSPRTIAAVAATVVLAFTATAFHQTRYWRDTDALFTHTLEVAPRNPIAEYSVGEYYQLSDPARALPHLQRFVALTDDALRANPAAPRPALYAEGHVAIGNAYMVQGNAAADVNTKLELMRRSAASYRAALAANPDHGPAKRNLALAESVLGSAGGEGAEKQADALIDAGFALLQKGDFEGAAAQFLQAKTIDPQSVEPRVYLAVAMIRAGRNKDAIAELREAQRLDPARANRYVTGILRLPQDDQNVEKLIAQLGG